MAYDQRGKRTGTGPYKDSFQRQQGKIGKRKLAGEKCPAESRKSTKGSSAFTEEELNQGFRRL
jgi:hypothetical protein